MALVSSAIAPFYKPAVGQIFPAQIRQASDDGSEIRKTFVRLGGGGDEFGRVGMTRGREQALRGSAFDQVSRVHDEDVIAIF